MYTFYDGVAILVLQQYAKQIQSISLNESAWMSFLLKKILAKKIWVVPHLTGLRIK